MRSNDPSKSRTAAAAVCPVSCVLDVFCRKPFKIAAQDGANDRVIIHYQDIFVSAHEGSFPLQMSFQRVSSPARIERS